MKEKGGPSSYVGHTHTEYLELTQYRVNDSAYIDGSACASQTTTVSTTGSHDPHTARSNRQTAWSPISCLSDFTNYEIFYEMYRSQITPECVKPTATLSECTNKGVKYYDEANDFSLEIPEGAIPEGETVTIDIGVALYGPFQYPEGLRPVSPVFWLCVRDKKFFHFLRPVAVTIPHFLDLENHNDIESLGLTFLKEIMKWTCSKCTNSSKQREMYFLNPSRSMVCFKPHTFAICAFAIYMVIVLYAENTYCEDTIPGTASGIILLVISILYREGIIIPHMHTADSAK